MSITPPPLKQYTLILPISLPPSQPPKILLGLKKRGLGVGKFNGFGGKVEPTDVSIPSAASRELHEESYLSIPSSSLHQCAVILLEAVDTAPVAEIHVFIVSVTGKEAEVQESEEMLPRWFGVENLPLEEMWEQSRHWMPDVLAEWVSGEGGTEGGGGGNELEIKGKRCYWRYVRFHGATNPQTGEWDAWYRLGNQFEEWRAMNGVGDQDRFGPKEVNEWLSRARAMVVPKS